MIDRQYENTHPETKRRSISRRAKKLRRRFSSDLLRVSIRAIPWLRIYTPMIPIGGVVFQRPRVKSGKSMGLLRLATDFSLNSVMQLQVAAS